MTLIVGVPLLLGSAFVARHGSLRASVLIGTLLARTLWSSVSSPVGLAESCADYSQGAHALGDAIIDGVEDLVCRHCDDGEIDRRRNL